MKIKRFSIGLTLIVVFSLCFSNIVSALSISDRQPTYALTGDRTKYVNTNNYNVYVSPDS